jgi:hypothetical protein
MMAKGSNPAGVALFEDLGNELVAGGQLEWGTLMSSDCLRRKGEFVGMSSHWTGALVVKLPKGRVAELIDAGAGASFAPNGRIFKEWVEVPGVDEDVWRGLIEESIAFADAKKG